MFKTHLCMVSAQAAPNLLPLLDDQFKPQEVILLVTDAMREKAKYLQEAIQPLGIKVMQHPFSATGNFHSMQQQLEDLLKPFAPGEIALNVTGGTKWMAITAQEVFRFNNRPVFYVDIDSGQLLFLDDSSQAHTLSAKIKLENYLRAYGYKILSNHKQAKGLTAEQRELCQSLVTNITEWGAALGQLNRLAHMAENNSNLTASLTALEKADPHLPHLLKECEAANILTFTPTNNSLRFSSDEARFFANGGWLEEYINSRINELKSEGLLQDNSHLNLKIASQNATNEVDVAFMANNRLHIIECKTRRLTGQFAGSAGTESLYKLDSIRDLGGLGTKSMLVSYRPLGNADAQRAQDLRIRVVQGEGIQRIKETIRRWILGN
ncbi:DUF1887 family protein [Saccharophagus sp. K07]|jgi:hypothetical protein|uniref:Card1-like endonuclease domain-containing protein n=1 Tax=Saccharophagus sp. K07 TaxID=2283636 RepID=UPI00165293FB|nr:DUF1887 family CARF protein [Saccharophagus sp. K07]MBC6907364.1 DUF1887 family protein [Saccharophagus sp. K07]